MENNKTLLPAQKNQIFNLIKKIGLRIHDFELIDVKSINIRDSKVSKLLHKSHSFYYIFDFFYSDSLSRNSIYSPDHVRNMTGENYQLFTIDDWEDLLKHFTNWIKFIYEQLKESDLWKLYSNQEFTTDARTITDLSNEKFIEPEKEKITENIDNIKAFIEENGFAKDDQQKSYVNDQTNYLKEALNRLGRRDWFLASITVINLVINTLNIDVKNARTIIHLLKQAFVGIKGLLGM